MAKWLPKTVQILLQLYSTHPPLAEAIRETIRKLEKNPALGIYLIDTTYSYSDSKGRFRINYNYNPEQKIKEIEVVSLVVL
ncbi:hypothetical protein WDW89_21190 [Deltaproteobacteria bacterium TL4]